MSMYNLKVQFETHYFRRNMHSWNDKITPAGSVLMNSIPLGQLLTVDRIAKNVMANKENDLIRNEKQCLTILDQLVKDGAVGAIHGERIWRACKDV